MPLHIRKAPYLKDDIVVVTFSDSDGRKGTVDLRDALQEPMFEVLRIDDEPGLQGQFAQWGISPDGRGGEMSGVGKEY